MVIHAKDTPKWYCDVKTVVRRLGIVPAKWAPREL